MAHETMLSPQSRLLLIHSNRLTSFSIKKSYHSKTQETILLCAMSQVRKTVKAFELQNTANLMLNSQLTVLF